MGVESERPVRALNYCHRACERLIHAREAEHRLGPMLERARQELVVAGQGFTGGASSTSARLGVMAVVGSEPA